MRNREKERERHEDNLPVTRVYLFLLNMLRVPMYVKPPHKVKMRRRAANKIARRSRRANRK